ncbi:MAG: proline dehydrogenase, partial [Bacteroidota bacterium]
MKDSAMPVNRREKIEQMDARVKDILREYDNDLPQIDFSNTENAFAYRTNDQLRKAAWLFGLMNKP